ncbi:hypothetical protein PG985_003711 [Apiospora marii]|uniref:uncharacterized protein n=1 Tax=Apiospora marii TaxID=335849 RepID=UPI00312D93DE
MDTIAAPVSITHGTYLDIQITLIVVASSFVAVRVWTNWRYTSKIRADDCEDDPPSWVTAEVFQEVTAI